MRQGLKKAFAISLMSERPRKRSRGPLDGPSEEAIADCLRNERVDFVRSQSNNQLCIGASSSSDKTFCNLL